jgi:hypothetical protein
LTARYPVEEPDDVALQNPWPGLAKAECCPLRVSEGPLFGEAVANCGRWLKTRISLEVAQDGPLDETVSHGWNGEDPVITGVLENPGKA